MMNSFKPMLAADALRCVDSLRFPLLASPKLDGIRAISWQGVLYSRNMKPIRNEHVQKMFQSLPSGLDGELMVGPANDPQAMTKAQSVIMSFDKPADEVTFNVFDTMAHSRLPFYYRLGIAHSDASRNPYTVTVPHTSIVSQEQLYTMEEAALAAGYEGVMLRDPNAVYKNGRSTPSEQGLLKLKRFMDSEAEVIGVEPRWHNANEQTRDELGRSKRSTVSSGLVAMDTLGAFRVLDIKTGQMFGIGTGLNDAQREKLWGVREQLIGKIVKYKYFPTGTVSAPRFPVFIGFRDIADMGG